MRVGIVGAGLAGICTADALGDRGADVVLFDALEASASGAPGAVLHPLPGRSLQPKEGVVEAFGRAQASLDGWRAAYPDLVGEFRMIRPLLEGDHGGRMLRTFEEARQELDRWDARIEETPFGRAVTYGPAFHVELGALVARERMRIGVRTRRVEQISPGADGVEVHGETFDHVVLAVGAALDTWIDGVELERFGGHLATLDSDANLDAIVSGRKHVAPLGNGRLVGGSTFWREGADAGVSEAEASAEIVDGVREYLPGATRVDVVDCWQGTRCVWSSERRPIVGGVTATDRVSIVGALGSKGLLYAPAAGEAAAAAIVDGRPIPESVRLPDDRRGGVTLSSSRIRQ